MSLYISILAAMVVAVSAAPPSAQRQYQHPAAAPAPAHLQAFNPYDGYLMDNSEVAPYYNQIVMNQAEQKQDERGPAPERLESLEPDSEVELIPGAQQPQQPPQQTPVNPNVPGLVPGQRGVFIVHMPVPGLRPGTIGGYQPVYIVAAAPQGNTGYANVVPAQGGPGVQGIQGVQGVPGYQNAILINPAARPGQGVSPYFGFPAAQPQYPGGQLQYPGQLAGLLFGPGPQNLGPQNLGPLGYRGFEQLYQQQVQQQRLQQVNPAYAYQQAGPQQQQQQQFVEGPRGGAVHLQQLIGLQQAQQAHANNQQQTNEALQNGEQKRIGEASESRSVESKEALREAPSPHARNAKPAPTQTQRNNKV